MNAKEYVEFIKENSYIAADSDAHRCMHILARNAQKITAKINGKYLSPEKIRKLFFRLIGKKTGVQLRQSDFGVVNRFLNPPFAEAGRR